VQKGLARGGLFGDVRGAQEVRPDAGAPREVLRQLVDGRVDVELAVAEELVRRRSGRGGEGRARSRKRG